MVEPFSRVKTPEASGVRITTVAGPATIWIKSVSVVVPVALLTSIWTGKSPISVGIPDIVAVAVEKIRPLGKAPLRARDVGELSAVIV
jgi:hypothetical protein